MVKSEKIDNCKSSISKFPCLGIYKTRMRDSFIVLFFSSTSSTEGTVVWADCDCYYQLGHIQRAWEISQFELYEGTVNLTND